MFSVTKKGKPLNKSLYNWDEKTKTFSTNESNLVLDFSDMNYVTFNTGSYCTFMTGDGCKFNTGDDCTFTTRSRCTFETGNDCVIVRRDIYEVIEIPENTKIKLNNCQVKGYMIIPEKHIVIIDGKEIELSEESLNNLKNQLIGE